jgi:hypothetical protein
VFGVGRFCPPASTSKARRSLSTKEQGCRRFVCTPALTYFPLLTARAGCAAISGRAATRLRSARCSRYSKCDNSHQQHYL